MTLEKKELRKDPFPYFIYDITKKTTTLVFCARPESSRKLIEKALLVPPLQQELVESSL